ncbi:Hsp20/alpha crystallin family protein [Haloprofundus salinisoli]|uniref:Hsp20/alpha crystallin family protein n=1 Tax=Haloprofundus salinisoli TaxID=2876193 RepID=UPI001CCD5AA4|nr:Hsp20/alpha crystallin family protein [Haloprofundus salinisoli]
MSVQQSSGGERFIRRYEYDDSWVIAAELGVADDAIDVDVVGTTAIVVVDHGDRVSETEFEFELPGTDATVETNNGVLTITVSK